MNKCIHKSSPQVLFKDFSNPPLCACPFELVLSWQDYSKDFNYSYFVNPASISVPIGSSQKFISRPLNFADTILIVGNKIQGGISKRGQPVLN